MFAMKAIWKDTILAQSNNTKEVEGNQYFPPESINEELFTRSTTETTCPWKGEARYYNIHVGDQRNDDAAWFYPEPKEAAKEIKDHVAFWKGVEVIEN